MKALMMVVLLTIPVLAHHSHGNYNMTEYTTLKGVVKELHCKWREQLRIN